MLFRRGSTVYNITKLFKKIDIWSVQVYHIDSIIKVHCKPERLVMLTNLFVPKVMMSCKTMIYWMILSSILCTNSDEWSSITCNLSIIVLWCLSRPEVIKNIWLKKVRYRHTCLKLYCASVTIAQRMHFLLAKFGGQKVKRESLIIALAFMFDLKFCAHFVVASGRKVMTDKLSEKYVVFIAQPENL